MKLIWTNKRRRNDTKTEKYIDVFTRIKAIENSYRCPFENTTRDATYLNINLTSPMISPTELSKHLFIFVRSAFSVHDYALCFLKKFGSRNINADYLKIRTSENMIDSPLHQIGVFQAVNSEMLLFNTKFQVVFVSPLRRAIETSFYLFKRHPRVHEITFVVLPFLRETILDVNDIPSYNIKTIKEQYSFLGKMNYNFTFLESYTKNDIYFMDKVDVGESEKFIASKNCDDAGFRQFMLHKLKECFPYPLESAESTCKRSISFIDFMKTFLQQNRITEGKHIGIITHNGILQYLAGVLNDSKKKRFDYCEIFPFTLKQISNS